LQTMTGLNQLFRKIRHFIIITVYTAITTAYCFSNTNDLSDTAVVNQYLAFAFKFKDTNPDSSFYFAQKSLDLSLSISSAKYISLAYQSLGRCYIIKEDFGKATNYFLEALKIEESRKDSKRIAELNDNLGYIYYLMENFKKSLDYYTISLEIFEKNKDTLNLANTISHIGNLHSSREFCEKRTEKQKIEDNNIALSYHEKALHLLEKIGNTAGIISVYNNLGVDYNNLQQPGKAVIYFTKAYDYYKSTENWNGIIQVMTNLGRSYCQLKQFEKSEKYFLESINESIKRNLTEGIQFIYEELSYTYDQAGEYKKARDYYVKYMIVRYSVYNNEKSKQIFELETRYQTEKKEKEILALNLKEKKQSQFIYILVSIILLILLTALYIIFRIRTKRKIAEQTIQLKEQRISELKKEHQLLSTQLVLEGEETERKRIARDLHDGLGGLLSGVKMSFNSVKGNLVLTGKTVKDFDTAIEMLDTSIKELRRVAHNMMPEGLVKFGLKEALADFCETLNSSLSMKVKFQFFGEFIRIEQKLEIGVYRIVQELVNNALKHAEAEEIIVQMVQEPVRLSIIVQDNGKGFDIKSLDKASGIGLSGVRTRIDALNGRIDIYSESGKGSEFTIEFQLT
jgi:two-component system NarL family sensor kinase